VALGSASRALAVVLSAYGNGDVVRIDLTDFHLETVAQMLKFIYTAELTLDCSTIAEVVCMLQLRRYIDACVQ
jgi:hypothetical protein